MKTKPVVLRALAGRDVDDAVDRHVREAGDAVALDFVAALEKLYASIAHDPGIGSPRYAHELDLPGLHSRSLRRFPYVVFYVERSDHIDLWRVLHSARDIPAWMNQADD